MEENSHILPVPAEEYRDEKGTGASGNAGGVAELISAVIASTPEEEFITERFVAIKKAALGFLDGTIGQEEFFGALSEMKDRIQETRRHHDDAYLLEDEWTIEVAAGDQLLTEGMNDYEEALIFLEENAGDKDEETIRLGIDMVYEANRKLVLNQRLVHYVEVEASRASAMAALKNSLKSRGVRF